MDSLRFYSFIATAPASHQIQKFDTAKIVISKAYGMIEGFDFSYFPDTLIELQYLRHGQVTNREVYNYEIGDEFHFVTYGFMMNPAGLNSYEHKIINKVIHNSDSLTYIIEQTHADNQNAVVIDTLSKTYNLNVSISDGVFIKGPQGNGVEPTWLFSDRYDTTAFVSSSDYQSLLPPLCRRRFEGFDMQEAVFGVGEFTHFYDGTSSNPKQYDEYLQYYKKGKKTWGTPLLLTSLNENKKRLIQIYPNPATDMVQILGYSGKASYQLTDLSGKLLKESELQAGKDEIEMGEMPTGVYLLKILTKEKTYIQKIILQ